MARRIEYTGPPILTLQEVADQVREDVADMQIQFVENVVIPGVTTQCETVTGAAIRTGTYEEDWPVSRISAALDRGQACKVLRVTPVDAPDHEFDLQHFRLDIGQRISQLTVGPAVRGVPLRITYRAGLDFAVWPGVKSWLLMQAASMYALRESMTLGAVAAPLPPSFLGILVADITVPPRF